MDLDSALQKAAETLGIVPEKPAPKRRAKKKVVKKQARAKAKKVGRPAKTQKPAAKPRKLPKTKLLGMRFSGDSVEMTFRDLRKLKTPLKYLDKRLTKLTARQLRQAEISKNGQSIAWADQGILVEVAYAMHCEA